MALLTGDPPVTPSLLTGLPSIVLLAFALPCRADATPQDWPSFRGTFARGRATDDARYPEKWNGEKGEGVRWKT